MPCKSFYTPCKKRRNISIQMSNLPIFHKACKNAVKKEVPANGLCALQVLLLIFCVKTDSYFLLRTKSTFTAQATEQPTIGLFPMPRKPIIST